MNSQASYLFKIGLFMIFTGFIVIILGSLLLAYSALRGLEAPSGAVIIFIGPFPVAVSWGAHGGLLMIIGLLIAILMIVLFLIMFRRRVVEVL
ncbi:MAG: hypothetical protein DRJ59_03270 [Thermoprotei archaeon]|nr:MAG: hypothetical protein DRJ59_03270 [Thermoprotei archaeon]